jgi:hypothetical protein
MSEEPTQSVRIDPSEEITEEKKLILLNQWREKVELEISDYSAEKEKVMAVYKVQKEKFDRLLSDKIKRMRKYDTVMNARKKVLQSIVVEIDKITPKL